jgi:magnesium and cobalt transporter
MSWFKKINVFFGKSLSGVSKDKLRHHVKRCLDHKGISTEQFGMIEGVLQFAELQVRDCMVPRAQMIMLHEEDDPVSLLQMIIDSKHSRFPFVGQSKDHILGILLAKDLLRCGADLFSKKWDAKPLLLKPTFVPESKHLDVLLRDFQKNHNHMAIVVDEYGNVSGLVTLEDVLEKIVGDIEDEYFVDSEAESIQSSGEHTFSVKAITPIEQFNEFFKAALDDERFDTVSGLVAQKLGRVPKVGDTVEISGFRFKVIHADKRRARLFDVEALSHERKQEK